MKKIFKYCGYSICILAVSIFLTRFWLNHPDMFLPFPRSIAEFLVRAYGAQNAEQIADLEILIGLSVSISVVTLVTLLLVWVVRKRSKLSKNT